jgi:DNA-binding NtrC family response regulator
MDRCRVFLVDDDSSLLELLVKYLERRGYEVATASTPEEALANTNVADAVFIVDITLPEMTGEELVSALRGKYPNLQAILTSGYPFEPRLEGVVFLQKPFLPQVLVAEIEKLVRA